MPITLGLNLSSLRAQSQLGRSSSQLSSVFERLSSGQRINRASDDAAGLAIAESLNSDARVFTQGIRNLNDGLSVLNVADGALNELTNITIRLAELAEQSANGVLGKQQRAALDEEAQALSDEYFRIVQSTEFNGRQLFAADYGELRLQAGFGLEGSIAEGLGGAVGVGTFTSQGSFQIGRGIQDHISGDFNGDGNIDLAYATDGFDTIEVTLGNGDGTFGAATSYAVEQAPREVEIGDFNGDGVLDLVSANYFGDSVSVLLGNGDGTFGAATSYAVGVVPTDVHTGDVNGDGITDIVSIDANPDTVSVLLGNGDGSFGAATSFDTGNTPLEGDLADYNNDGILDIAVVNATDDTVGVLLGNGDGTFAAQTTFAIGPDPTSITSGDFNGDGVLDLVTTDTTNDTLSIFLGNGDGTFTAGATLAAGNSPRVAALGDFDGNGIEDIAVIDATDREISIFTGNGDGTFQDGETYTVAGTITNSIVAADFNNDGVLDLSTGAFFTDAITVLFGDTVDGVAPLLEFSLNSIADAKQALSQFTQKIDQLSEQRGQIGAFQARLQVAENVLQVTTENYRAAESRIRDADIAQEAADLVRLQILQQAGASVLGQANLQPQLVLQLLGGGS